MFSTGMDSVMMKSKLKFENEECLFVNMGTVENKIELKLVQEKFPGTHIIDFPLAQFELPNKIIPFRNHFLTLIGAQFSNNIYFAFTKGDLSHDKNEVFKYEMENTVNYFIQKPRYSNIDSPFTIHIPFKPYTKKQLVEEYIKNEQPQQLFTHSISCYNGIGRGCGKCKSCIRKYVAIKLNGFNCEGFFEQNPVEFLDSFLEESIQKGRWDEVEDIKLCIQISKND